MVIPRLCDDGSGAGETTFRSSKLMTMTMMKTGLRPQKSQMMRSSQHRLPTHQRENRPEKLPMSVDLVQNSYWSTRSEWCSRSQVYHRHARRPSPNAQMLTTITADHIGEVINASATTLHRFRSLSTASWRRGPVSYFCWGCGFALLRSRGPNPAHAICWPTCRSNKRSLSFHNKTLYHFRIWFHSRKFPQTNSN